MADAFDRDNQNGVFNRINDSIIADPYPKRILTTDQLATSTGARAADEAIDSAQHPALHIGIEAAKILLGGTPKTNGVFRHFS